jgi:hypothetical protein
MASPQNLPSPAEDSSGAAGVLILALPRSSAEPAALDRFLKKQKPGKNIDLFFLYEEGEKGNDKAAALKEAAGTCAAIYGRKPGIHAHYAGV